MTTTIPPTVISRHRTSEGVLVYGRDHDGSLVVWLQPRLDALPWEVARGGPYTSTPTVSTTAASTTT